MNTKKLITLVALLAAVVGIIVLTENMDKLSGSSKSNTIISGLSENNISAFSIADTKDTVKIRRKGDIWIVTPELGQPESSGPALETTSESPATASVPPTVDYPADSASVATALEKLGALATEDLVSNNPEKQELFEVDSAHGVLVTVWDLAGKNLGAFRIGKNGPDWSSHYVRAIGSDKVYSIGGSIKSSFFSDEKRWRDKSIQKFDKQLAKSVTLLNRGGDKIELVKALDSAGTDTWTIVAPETLPASTEKVEKLLDALANLRAADWEENASLTDDTLGFSSPELIASVSLDNGDSKEIIVGAKKDGDSKFWVRASGNTTTYLVADYTVRSFDLGLDDLKGEPTQPSSTDDE